MLASSPAAAGSTPAGLYIAPLRPLPAVSPAGEALHNKTLWRVLKSCRWLAGESPVPVIVRKPGSYFPVLRGDLVCRSERRTPRRSYKTAVRIMKRILQCRYVKSERAEPIIMGRRPWKRHVSLKVSLEELSGTGGAECCDSQRRNRRDLTGSEAHTLRNSGYKHVAKSWKTPREKSDEPIIPVTAGVRQTSRGKGLCFHYAQRGGK